MTVARRPSMGSWVHGGQLDGDHIVRCGAKGGLETCDVGVVVRTARNWSFFLDGIDDVGYTLKSLGLRGNLNHQQPPEGVYG